MRGLIDFSWARMSKRLGSESGSGNVLPVLNTSNTLVHVLVTGSSRTMHGEFDGTCVVRELWSARAYGCIHHRLARPSYHPLSIQ